MQRLLMILIFAVEITIPARSQPVGTAQWQREIERIGDLLVVRAYCTPDKSQTVLEFLDPFDGTPRIFFTDGPFKIVDEKCVEDNAKAAIESALGTASEITIYPPSPNQVALRPRYLYLTSVAPTETLQALDLETFEVVATVDFSPRLPGGLKLSPDGERLYATLWRSTTATPPLPAQILILDTATNQVLDRITLTGDMLPSEPAVSLDGKLLYFSDGTAGLVVVDLANKTIAQSIPASAAGGATNQLRSLALSPDGGLICVTDSFGIALLETHTRTFVGRVNISLQNREMPPVFHPNGSKVYIIERRTVSGASAISLVAIDTASLTEAGRVTLPDLFDPRNLVITPDGLSLAMDGFLRPAGQPAKAVLILVDTTTNTVLTTTERAEPYVGALGVILHQQQ